jgi:hypothetical protein
MGLRFYRRFKILPGVSINLSRSGVTTSIGVKGAHVTVGHGKVRETVGLPGTGLSYTHVEGSHQPHQGGAGEARTPAAPDALPKGTARRGWLCILLLLAISITIAVLLTSCGEKPQPPPVLAPGIGPPIAPAPTAPDPRVVYELREKCGKDAQAWYHHYFEENVTKVPGYTLINSSFTSHYSERMNQCFAVVISLTSSRDDKTKVVKFFDDRLLADVLENRDLGTFMKFSNMDRPMDCSVHEKNCTSLDQWQDLTKPFMEQ